MPEGFFQNDHIWEFGKKFDRFNGIGATWRICTGAGVFAGSAKFVCFLYDANKSAGDVVELTSTKSESSWDGSGVEVAKILSGELYDDQEYVSVGEKVPILGLGCSACWTNYGLRPENHWLGST